ncbi:MAG: hypothetical protein ACLFRU_00460 [Paracoccaceae bacterium]
MRLAGVAQARLDALRESVQAEMRQVRDTARVVDWPDSATAYADVQDTGCPTERAF